MLITPHLSGNVSRLYSIIGELQRKLEVDFFTPHPPSPTKENVVVKGGSEVEGVASTPHSLPDERKRKGKDKEELEVLLNPSLKKEPVKTSMLKVVTVGTTRRITIEQTGTIVASSSSGGMARKGLPLHLL